MSLPRARTSTCSFYTKSNNIDHLLELKNRERCLYYATLASDRAAREFEPGAPSLDQRIQALRRCQDAGYTVRAGFSPIIPIREWREDATVAIEKLFAKVTPDTVRLWVLSMTPVPQFDGALGFARMDQHLAEMAIRADPQKVGWWNAPLPRRGPRRNLCALHRRNRACQSRNAGLLVQRIARRLGAAQRQAQDEARPPLLLLRRHQQTPPARLPVDGGTEDGGRQSVFSLAVAGR